MTRHRVIIDCDPGQDDAVNLLLALASRDDLDILGITTVAGNVPLDLTQRNARVIADLADCPDIPVFAGCARPMARAPITAHMVHGPSGLDGMTIGTPQHPLDSRHAVAFLIETLSDAADDTVTLVATGPQTNLATAIVQAPDILPKIRAIVAMGGAMREAGNFTPSAEFNILADPHAAHTVLTCGRPVTLLGLDVTHQALVTPDRLAHMAAPGGPVADAVAGMLGFFNRFDSTKYGTDGAPLHDPCTIAYLLAPTLFETKRCHVAVETGSPLTLGHTAVDFWGVTGQPANATWVYAIDASGFYDMLADRLHRFARPAA